MAKKVLMKALTLAIAATFSVGNILWAAPSTQNLQRESTLRVLSAQCDGQTTKGLEAGLRSFEITIEQAAATDTDKPLSIDFFGRHTGKPSSAGQVFSDTNSIKLTVAKDKVAMAWQALHLILADYYKAIAEKGYYVLGLATGSTPIGLYALLVECAEQGLIDFTKIYTFNMDEYEGLKPEDVGNMTPQNPGDPNVSYKAFMYKHIFGPLFAKGLVSQKWIDTHVDIFESNPEDAERMLLDYENKIDKLAGVDTWIGGIGSDCHIAFNEPKGFRIEDGKRIPVDSKTTPDSVSRRVQLTQSTIDDNCGYFEFIDRDDASKRRRWVKEEFEKLIFVGPNTPGAREITYEEALSLVPRTAFSIGIKTYKNAKHQIVMANGDGKAKAVVEGMEKEPNNDRALSLLQDCPNCDLIIDKKAASRLINPPAVTSVSMNLKSSSAGIIVDPAEIKAYVWLSAFSKNDEVVKKARQKIRDMAAESGIWLSSIRDLYKAKAEGRYPHFTIPAINIRSMTYDTARTLFEQVIKNKVGAFIIEIAQSEISYTSQRPDEYATTILAAALAEGYKGPIFLKLDHAQLKKKDYAKDPEKEMARLEALCYEAIDAGFYNIDIDTSTIAKSKKETSDVVEQQRPNFEATAYFVERLRAYAAEYNPGITLALGGEIGEVGKKEGNSTIEELIAYLDGLNSIFATRAKELGKEIEVINILSPNTGTAHGGVFQNGKRVQPKPEEVLSTLKEMSKKLKEYGIAGPEQHGSSTLKPTEAYFPQFPKVGADEVHLATELMNIILDHPAFPVNLRQEFNRVFKEKYFAKYLPNHDNSEEETYLKERKRVNEDLKHEIWNIPAAAKAEICERLRQEFEMYFKNLNVRDTADLPEVKNAPSIVKSASAGRQVTKGEVISMLADEISSGLKRRCRDIERGSATDYETDRPMTFEKILALYYQCRFVDHSWGRDVPPVFIMINGLVEGSAQALFKQHPIDTWKNKSEKDKRSYPNWIETDVRKAACEAALADLGVEISKTSSAGIETAHYGLLHCRKDMLDDILADPIAREEMDRLVLMSRPPSGEYMFVKQIDTELHTGNFRFLTPSYIFIDIEKTYKHIIFIKDHLSDLKPVLINEVRKEGRDEAVGVITNLSAESTKSFTEEARGLGDRFKFVAEYWSAYLKQQAIRKNYPQYAGLSWIELYDRVNENDKADIFDILVTLNHKLILGAAINQDLLQEIEKVKPDAANLSLGEIYSELEGGLRNKTVPEVVNYLKDAAASKSSSSGELANSEESRTNVRGSTGMLNDYDRLEDIHRQAIAAMMAA